MLFLPSQFMKKSAFTLIELLVVIVIIGVLATISVAQFNDYVEKARRAKALAFSSQVIKSMELKLDKKVAYWNFEGATNTNIPDSSGNGHDLTWIYGSPGTPASYIVRDFENFYSPGLDYFSHLGGNGPVLKNTGTLDLDIEKGYTTLYWINPQSMDQSGPMSVFGGIIGIDFYSEGATARFADGTPTYSYWLDTPLKKDTWQLVVHTYDNATQKNTIWIDGNKVLEDKLSMPLTNTNQTDIKLTWSNSNTFNIDEVWIWEDVLEFN
jgi:prepilin-type N-terminal cleavage/methylation domain-containing protein